MKKTFVLSLVLALVLGLLVACGTTETTGNTGNGSESGTAATDGKASAKLTIIDKDGASFEYTLSFTDGTTMR